MISFDMNPSVFYFCIYLLLSFITSSVAMADNRGVGVYFDQDLFTPLLNEDRDYTMGFAVEVFKDKGTNILDGVLCDIAKHLDLHCTNNKSERSYVLGSVNYTPDDISSTNPVQNDRPYASLLYFSSKRVVASSDSAVGVELQAGVLGLKVGEEIQEYFHEAWRGVTGKNEPVDPRGWCHQISDGGEPAFRFRFSNLQLLKNRHQSEDWWDSAWIWDTSVGYQTNASLGLMARGGKIRSDIWTVPYDPINRGNFLPATKGDEWYFWAAGRTRLVGYDALLQGQFRNSDVTFNSNEIEQLVFEGALGLTGGYGPVQITLAINGKSSEVKKGAADRNHYWGGLYVMYRY